MLSFAPDLADGMVISGQGMSYLGVGVLEVFSAHPRVHYEGGMMCLASQNFCASRQTFTHWFVSYSPCV